MILVIHNDGGIYDLADKQELSDILAEVNSIICKPKRRRFCDSLSTVDKILAGTSGEALLLQKPISMRGWTHFNRMLSGGIFEKEFSIICGPTGAGKTTMLANMAHQLIGGGVPTFVASVETGPHDFYKKLVSIELGVDMSREGINVLKVVEDMPNQFNSKNHVFTNYDSRVSTEDILCDLLYSWKHYGIRVALIDNLQFMMEVTRGADQIVVMDKTVHDFVIFCKNVPLHIFMVMHPRKTEGGRVMSEFDIKGSSTAVQEASNIILLNRLAKPEDAPLGVNPTFCRELKFAKVRRNGRATGGRVLFGIDEKTEKYREVGFIC